MEELGVLFHTSLFQILTWTLLWSLLAQGWGWVGGEGWGSCFILVWFKFSVELFFEACWHRGGDGWEERVGGPVSYSFEANSQLNSCLKPVGTVLPDLFSQPTLIDVNAMFQLRILAQDGARFPRSGVKVCLVNVNRVPNPPVVTVPDANPTILEIQNLGSVFTTVGVTDAVGGVSESPGLLKALSGSGRVHGKLLLRAISSMLCHNHILIFSMLGLHYSALSQIFLPVFCPCFFFVFCLKSFYISDIWLFLQLLCQQHVSASCTNRNLC